jgi:periplasmic copper chaperone A
MMRQQAIKRRTHGKQLSARCLWFCAALLAAFTGMAAAAQPFASVGHARIRWLPSDLPLAGYFDLTNAAPHPLTLMGASSTAFQNVMMHQTVHSGGEARMLPVQSVTISPGQTLHFAPDGYHLMLMHRTAPLSVGDHVAILLKFSDGRLLKVPFAVKGADLR